MDSRSPRAAREARYLELIRDVLPRVARERGWHVRFDHCFGRIVLDNVLGRCWYDVLDRRRPAYRQLDDDQLERAIALAESVPTDLRELDARSLAWRRERKARIVASAAANVEPSR
ncbi:MAG: hypothetical protein NVS2B8_11280 [Vulcanimicrobiaceae bacterium]